MNTTTRLVEEQISKNNQQKSKEEQIYNLILKNPYLRYHLLTFNENRDDNIDSHIQNYFFVQELVEELPSNGPTNGITEYLEKFVINGPWKRAYNMMMQSFSLDMNLNLWTNNDIIVGNSLISITTGSDTDFLQRPEETNRYEETIEGLIGEKTSFNYIELYRAARKNSDKDKINIKYKAEIGTTRYTFINSTLTYKRWFGKNKTIPLKDPFMYLKKDAILYEQRKLLMPVIDFSMFKNWEFPPLKIIGYLKGLALKAEDDSNKITSF